MRGVTVRIQRRLLVLRENRLVVPMRTIQSEMRALLQERIEQHTAFVSFSTYPCKVAVRVVTAPVCGDACSARSCLMSEAQRQDELSTGGSRTSVFSLTDIVQRSWCVYMRDEISTVSIAQQAAYDGGRAIAVWLIVP